MTAFYQCVHVCTWFVATRIYICPNIVISPSLFSDPKFNWIISFKISTICNLEKTDRFWAIFDQNVTTSSFLSRIFIGYFRSKIAKFEFKDEFSWSFGLKFGLFLIKIVNFEFFGVAFMKNVRFRVFT